MSLPIRTTVDDVDAGLRGYLATKPTGASLAEAKAVVDSRRLDGRKLTALKYWGLIEDDDGKLKITELGRRSVRDSGARRSEVLREVVSQVRPYLSVVERVVHRGEETISATDVAAHWHEHFRGDVSESDKTLNNQAVCFFHIAQGADLGRLVIGRKGQPTRFEFDSESTRTLIDHSAEVIEKDSTETHFGEGEGEGEGEGDGETTAVTADRERVDSARDRYRQ